jgi:hypothetical protein
MKTLILAAFLAIQSPAGGPVSSAALYPRFHPKVSGPLSFDINQPARGAFEAVANQAGLSLIFDRDYRAPVAPVKLNLQNVDIFSALDSLAAATRTFWVPVGNQTVFIADDNVTKHRDYDLAQIAVFKLTGPKTYQELADIMNAVRQQTGITSMVAFPKTNSLILKDSPAKVDAARKRLLELSLQTFGPSATVDRVTAYEADPADNVYLSDGSTINFKRTQLRPTINGLLSLDINGPARTAFETIASKAGFTILFDRDYRTSPTVTLKLNDLDVFTALDMTCLAARTFWFPVGDHTIFIVDNNSTKRRDYDPNFVDVVHLTGAKAPQDVNDVMNVVRQIVNVTTMVANPGANALLFKDTSQRAALAEQLIADLEGQLNGTPRSAAHSPSYQTEGLSGGSGNVYLLDGTRRNINPLLAQLHPTTTAPLSFDISQPSKSAFETIAAKAGLSVIFDTDFRVPTPATITLKLSNTDIYTALDIVSTQLRLFWVPVGSQTIFVAENSSTKHRDFDPLAIEVADISGVQSVQALNDFVNDVRQILNVGIMDALPRTNSLLIFDAPYKNALAKALIADIQSSNAAPAGAAAVSSVLSIETDSLTSFSNPSAGLRSYSAPATAQLRPSAAGPFTLHINADARRAYETLGESVGLNVMFDPRFSPGQPAAFHMENVDAIQALDLMGKQTGNSWQVVDSKTIFVTSENVSSRRLYEPTAVKTFHLANVPVPELNFIVTLLRNVLNISNVMTDPASNTIDVRSTPSNLAIVEKLLSVLDRPAPAR